MPQLLVAALVGAGLWAGFRFLRRGMSRVAGDLRAAEARLRRQRGESPRVTLVRDPETGIYRPERG